MADPTLIQRAEAAGIAPEFRDWRGQQVAVSEQTLTAILDALDSVPDLPRTAGGGEGGGGGRREGARRERASRAPGAHGRAPAPSPGPACRPGGPGGSLSSSTRSG